MSRLLPILIVATLVPAAAYADSTLVAVPDVHIVRAPSAITIDGRITEPAWQASPVVSDFKQRDPNTGAPGSQRTEVWLLYDDDAIYVAARLHDASPDSIVKQLTRRDAQSRSDYFQVFLDPYYDRRSGFYFGVNAAGTLYDGTMFNDNSNDNSWDGVWEGRSSVDGSGWSVEMRIPFSQIRFARANPQRWGINFYRSLGRGFEDDYLVYQPKNENGFVSRFPTLVGLEGVTPGNALEIVPYVTSKAEFLRHEPFDPFDDGWRRPNGGGDLRMPLGGKLTLNATVNPDFGHVEVDPAVVNLSDIETVFQEKRPFFVEGSSIFSAGQQGAGDYWNFNWQQPTFFYSRRIGRAPQGQLPDDTEFRDAPTGTTILGAAKVSGKIGAGGNLGTLHALTARETADLRRIGFASDETMEIEPLTYYGVTRYLKEFAERRHGLGILTTVAARRFDDARLEDQLNRTSLVAALDGWHFLDASKTWVLSGWAGGSHITGNEARITAVQTSPRHYYQRPDAISFELDTTATSLSGAGARVWLNKEKGNWLVNAAAGVLSPGLDVDDLGFLGRADMVNAHAGFGYNWSKNTKHIRFHHLLGAVYAGTNFDGDVTDLGVWGKKFWWWANNWVTELTASYNAETVNPRRSRGGPRMKNAPEWNVSTFWDTDGGRVRYYYVSARTSLAPDEDSHSWYVEPGITYRPMPNVSFQLGPSIERTQDGAFLFATLDDPAATATYGRRYVFSQLEQTTIAANLRFNVSFTPAMSLQFFGQPFVSTGEFRDLKELARPNSLDFVGPGAGAWTYDPATGAFDPDGAGGQGAFTRDFNFKSLRGNMVYRWEYRPGSAFFLVWTQERTDFEPIGDLDVGDSFSRLGSADADNIFLAKVTYYLSR